MWFYIRFADKHLSYGHSFLTDLSVVSMFVGEDIILPPFIKIALRFTRAVGGLAAARSRSRSRNALRCFSLRSRRYATPALTGLCDICYFGCRGDHWSSVIYKNIILFKKDRRGRRSLQICTIFVILIVGRWLAAAVYKVHCVLCGTPRTSSPTGSILTLIFACRGGYYPPAYSFLKISKM